MIINYDQNYYDVMRQIIENEVNGKCKSQTSIWKDGKQYLIEGTYVMEELHFENDNVFKPMKENNDEIVIETVPEIYDGNEVDYAWVVCQCLMPITKGLKIPKHLFKNGECKFRCKNCGLVGTLVSNKI